MCAPRAPSEQAGCPHNRPERLATLRAQSMNTCATGLIVRFLGMMIAIGSVVGKSIGRTLISGVPAFRNGAEVMLTNRPLATRALRIGRGATTVALGIPNPLPLKASATTTPKG